MAYYNYPQYPYMYPQAQSYTSNVKSMEWVDGEVGAKAFQMPQGWPPETPIALWDNSEKRIWLKSWNSIGMANPMQEINYTIKERTNPALLPNNISGDTQYIAKKDFDELKSDFDELKEELHNLSRSMQNNGNRGGNR